MASLKKRDKGYQAGEEGHEAIILFSPLSIIEFMLSHVGLKLTPLALYKSVREDHQELATPVDAVNYILRHRHSNLNKMLGNYLSHLGSTTHLKISFVNADSQFWVFLLEFGD